MRAQRIPDRDETYVVCEALDSPVLVNDGPVFEVLNDTDKRLFGAFCVVRDGKSGIQRVKLLSERESQDEADVIRRVGTEWLRRNGPLSTDGA